MEASVTLQIFLQPETPLDKHSKYVARTNYDKRMKREKREDLIRVGRTCITREKVMTEGRKDPSRQTQREQQTSHHD